MAKGSSSGSESEECSQEGKSDEVASWIHADEFKEVPYKKVDHFGYKPNLNYAKKAWDNSKYQRK